MLEDYFFSRESAIRKKASLGDVEAQSLLAQQDHLNNVNGWDIFLCDKDEEPEVTPSQLMGRLVEGGSFTPQALLVGFILLERYIRSTKIRGRISMQRVFAAACFVAHKYLEDKDVWFFEDYSILTLIPVEICKNLEAPFMEGLEYKASVNERQCKQYLKILLKAESSAM